MANKAVLILGGYSGARFSIARLLLQESDVAVIFAGRHKQRADQAAAQLNRECPGRWAIGAYADASQIDSLQSAFQGVGMVLWCSTTVKYVKEVAQAALAAGIDYML